MDRLEEQQQEFLGVVVLADKQKNENNDTTKFYKT
jgi:hypothetical protein